MGGFLRRRFWVVTVVAVGGMAGLAAHALRQVLEATFVPAAVPAVTPPTRPAAPSAGREKVMLAHNIFCSACPPPQPGAGPGEGVAREPRSRLPVTLVGTLITPEAIRSVAVIRDRGAGPTDDPDGARLFPVAAYRPGDRVAGYPAVVERVDARRVYLRVNGRLEYLDLPTPSPPRQAAPRPARAPRGAI